MIMLAACLVAAGCARPLRYEPATLPPAPVVDRALEDRILALDPERVSEADVRDVLAKGPAPRIMLLHGGIYPVHLSMTSFGRFLVEMGYPEAQIRDPYDGSWSHSPYEDAERLAGIAAWYYEKDGMPPMLIGHSQGGMQAVKVLYVLAGKYSPVVPVWNPLTDFPEDRSAIIDPLTGRKQPVVGLRLVYVSAIGAGGAAFLLPNQWSLLGRLRTIPDTVEAFTGYSIDVDFWAWTVPGDASRTFANHGRAQVRNVTLPAGISHVAATVSADVPQNKAMLAWVEAYTPGTKVPPPPDSEDNLLWVADVWWSVKKYWVIEAQRWIRARRAGHAVAGS
ncbi:MAG: hypothetical protein IT518_11565 [Burkholderiales bacterium]|nr:hypothetical protein [Burkholderiales bacterium]